MSSHTAPLQAALEDHGTSLSALSSQLAGLRTSLDHEPLLAMIGRNRQLIENLMDDVRKLRETENRAALTQHIHKVELQLNMAKNDLQ